MEKNTLKYKGENDESDQKLCFVTFHWSYLYINRKKIFLICTPKENIDVLFNANNHIWWAISMVLVF